MKILRQLLLTTLLIVPLGAWAQGSLFLHSTSGAVHMRWNAPLGEDFDGFHVERQASGGAWERLTDSPITPIYEVADIEALMGPNAESYLTFFGANLQQISPSDQRQVMSDPFARGMIQLQSVRFPAMADVLGERFRDYDLQPGQAFRYRILRLNGGSESTWAESSRAVTHGSPDEVPLPTGFRGEGAEESAQVTWDFDQELSREGRLVSFRLYRAETPSGPFLPANADPIIPTRVNGELPEFLYLDRFLENGQSYWFRLAGLNVLGFEGAQTEAVKITPRDETPPPPPENIRARLHGEGAMLQWAPVSVPDLEGYSVYRGAEPNGAFERIWPDGDAAVVPRITFIDENVPEGATYYYFMTAVDSSGNESRASDRVQLFRPDLTPPVQVQGVVAEAKDEGKEPGVHLRWEANSESDLTGYIVERTTRVSGKGEETAVEDRFFGENIDPLQDTSYVDPVPATSQSRYAYRIVALDEAGNRSEPSEIVIARMPDKVPPTRPAIWQVRQEDGQVAVTWQSNIEEDLAGYRIYRSEDDENFAALNEELVTELRYVDGAGSVGAIYHYRLTALDETGNESEPSQSLSVKYLDTQAPEPPAIVRIDVVETGLEVHWDSVPEDVATIILYRTADGETEPSIRGYLHEQQPLFLDEEVEEDRVYQYFLRVTDSLENVSDPGVPASQRYEKPDES